MEFLPYDVKNFAAVKAVLESAFDDPRQSRNFSSLGLFEEDESYKRFVVKDGDTVIGYLGYALRTLRYLGQSFAAASIGPVAVSPQNQRSGIGSFLMSETIQHLKHTGVEIVYIQGIPDYYQRFDFIKYLDKSKRVISTDQDDSTGPHDLHIAENNVDNRIYRDLYELYTEEVDFSAKRTEADWTWLLGPATQTYYFYQPKLIQTDDGRSVGYFCDDSEIDNSPRELVCVGNKELVARTLEALKSYYSSKGCDSFELKAPESSQIVALADEMGCQKVTYVNPRGGDLMLIYDEHLVAQKLAASIPDALHLISVEFSAQLNFGPFLMDMGVANGEAYASITSNTESSPLNLVHFMAGRIRGDLLNYTKVTGFNSYEAVQKLLFSGEMGFVFQGDNM